MNYKPISEHEEVYLKHIMKKFDVWASIFTIFFFLFFLYAFNFLPSFPKEEEIIVNSIAEEDPNKIENGIHIRSGLIVGDGYKLVLNNCGGCHSHKLVTQNQADAIGWTETIHWMQKTQNLWDLGENEAPIVAYLAKYYGAKKKSRRENLKNIDWYALD